jgi:beta-glucanase (GH16 family)
MRAARLLFVLLAALLLTSVTAPAQAQSWADEFNASGAPGSGWTYDTGNSGFGNNELQYYQSGGANANQAGGILTIQARRQAVGTAQYTSARLKTQGIRNFGPYGRVEARLQGPMGQGLWPAFWMLGSNITSVPWPGCGEIDIMEHINTAGNTVNTIHWDNGGYVFYTASSPAVGFTAYHNYAIVWDANQIAWQIDGVQNGAANIAGNINGTEEFHRSFFVIMNLAVGGTWPGNPNASTAFPANFNVDWFRYTAPGGTVPTPTTPPSATPTTPPGGNTIVLNAFYSFTNRASGKCMDARSSAVANGTVVQQYTCNNTFAQHWQIQDAGGGYYRINQRNSVPQVLDIVGVNAANGAKTHLWSYVGGANQQWRAEASGTGSYRFIARHSGRCLDVPSGAATESLQLQQYDCNTSNAQQFSLIQR